jgi:hypothetical protein
MKIIKTLRDTILPRFKPQEHEQLIIDIIGLLFQDDDTECITAPISGKYYISNKRLRYWVKIGDMTITITNHKFTYIVQTPLPFNDYIINVVREYIEKDREDFEKRVFQNELELLKNIKSSIIGEEG